MILNSIRVRYPNRAGMKAGPARARTMFTAQTVARNGSAQPDISHVFRGADFQICCVASRMGGKNPPGTLPTRLVPKPQPQPQARQDDRSWLTMQMDRADSQLARLTNADNRISPEDHVALHVGFRMAELHRKDAKLR